MGNTIRTSIKVTCVDFTTYSFEQSKESCKCRTEEAVLHLAVLHLAVLHLAVLHLAVLHLAVLHLAVLHLAVVIKGGDEDGEEDEDGEDVETGTFLVIPAKPGLEAVGL